jgi:hypothetical protein
MGRLEPEAGTSNIADLKDDANASRRSAPRRTRNFQADTARGYDDDDDDVGGDDDVMRRSAATTVRG